MLSEQFLHIPPILLPDRKIGQVAERFQDFGIIPSVEVFILLIELIPDGVADAQIALIGRSEVRKLVRKRDHFNRTVSRRLQVRNRLLFPDLPRFTLGQTRPLVLRFTRNEFGNPRPEKLVKLC